MTKETNKNELLIDYFERWIRVYKEGAVRPVTMNKYVLALTWLKKLVPELKLKDLDRIAYQKLLNEYAKHHERQTTMDFHHQLKGAILDAVDEGLIARDPTRKTIIKGKTPRAKKPKYLSQFELHTLLKHLDLSSDVSWDWLSNSNPLKYTKNLYLNNELVTELVIPNTVTEIKPYAFDNCSSLTSVVINAGSIGDSVFFNCNNLTSVEIGDSVNSIGDYAFYGCESLTNVVIGDSVNSIGDYAFYNCSSLTSVVIGDSVTSIGANAFYNCSSLTNVYYKGTAEDWEGISMASSVHYELRRATRYYYSESEPTTSGNYWHYDENGEIAVW